jgi:hypothetical protein
MSQDPKARVMLSHFPYPSSWIFIPLFTHLSMNQACIRLLRISRTHPHRRSFSNLGDSAATSIATPFHQILIKMEEGPNKRNEVAILADHVLVLILRRFMPAPYATRAFHNHMHLDSTNIASENVCENADTLTHDEIT